MKIALWSLAINGVVLYGGQSMTQIQTHHAVTHHAVARHTTSSTPTTRSSATKSVGSTKTAGAAKSTHTPPPTGSSVNAAQAKAALDFHNAKRAEVGAPPLRWSLQLASIAQAWADHLAKDLQCKLQHSPNNPYGENIFGGRGSYSATDAVQMWYGEKPKYSGEVLTTSNYSSAGHYTQMMWQATTEVGIGVGRCDGALVVVAEYSPHGNVLGQKPY